MPSTTSKNLGQIAAYISGATAPTNTNLVWLDTSGETSIKKIYDPKTSTWIPLQTGSTSDEGEGWGEQVIVSSEEFTGNGTEEEPLTLAEQGATSGQALRWDGEKWSPGDDPVVEGLEVVSHSAEFLGTGLPAAPLTLVKPPNPATNEGYILKWDTTLGMYKPLPATVAQQFVRGMMIMWNTINSIPSGWVECNGNNNAEINGVKIPDMRGFVPVGYSADDINFNVIGKRGGTKTNTLEVRQLPSHTHSVNDPGHSHPYSAPLVSGDHPGGSSGYDRPNSPNNGSSGSAKTNITIGNTGSGETVNNLQPYNTVVFIIYVG